MTISASVGLAGANIEADVMAVQRLLNAVILTLGLPLLVEDGICADNTILAIQAYQAKVMEFSLPDGRVDPGGRTWGALVEGRLPRLKHNNSPGRLSGGAWWDANQARYPNSRKLGDLASPFREGCIAFTAAIQAAGASVSVSATLRDPRRAKLMLYCWQIARGQRSPANVPAIADCDILWDHGDIATSRKAAREMVKRFGIVRQPALGTTLHSLGRAIDMTISWAGTISIEDAHGVAHAIDAPHSAEINRAMHAVGASYGVIKFVDPDQPDPPHWSDTGH